MADSAVVEETSSSRRGQLWKRASFLAKNTVAFSQSFRTLRDMVQECYVDPDALHFIKRLGEGSFATVSLQTYEERTVAVKHLKPSLLQSDRDLTDFFNEAALLKKLSHSAIVGFVGVAVDLRQLDEAVDLKRTKSMRKRAVESFANLIRMKNPEAAINNETSTEDAAAAGADTGGPLHESPVAMDETATTEEGGVMVQPRNVMIVQEYMNGGTLKGLMLKQMERSMRCIYTRRQGLEWLIQVAQGLKYLHGARPRIIHRDLKLENIMLTKDASGEMVAKIGDFGLHAVLKAPKRVYEPDVCDNGDGDIIHSFSDSMQLSQNQKNKSIKAAYALSGRTGSLMYMAPEVLRCQPYNEKADVFSFALIMYEVFSKTIMLCFVCCTGEPNEIEHYAQRIACGHRPAVPEAWPAHLKSLVQSCWSQDPANRPTVTEIVESLKTFRDLDWIDSEQYPTGCSCCVTQ